MFQTQPSFAHPFQLDAIEKQWRAVELAIEKPIYIIKVHDEAEHVVRTFMYMEGFDVVSVVEQFSFGRIIEAHLLIPPEDISTWKALRIRKIGNLLAADGSPRGAVVMDSNNSYWTVNPLKCLEHAPKFREMLSLD